MKPTLQIPLDLPDIKILNVESDSGSGWVIQVESTLRTGKCHRCGRELKRFHGFDRAIRLRHLPILEQLVWIEIRPKRFRCEHCEGDPTSTQRCRWYQANSPHTKAYDRWVLKLLMNSTVLDVSRHTYLGYAAVEGVINRWLSETVDWSQFDHLETLGIDEIALKKGHGDFVAVVTHRSADGQISVLAVLPDRLKATVKGFLSSIPARLQPTIQRVCTDMYEGYTNAVREVLPQAELIIDRFHVAQAYNKGADQLRKQVMKALKTQLSDEDYDEFKGLLWVFRKNWGSLDDEQRYRLVKLFSQSPELKQAYCLRQALTAIFETTLTKVQALERLEKWEQLVSDSGLTCFDAFRVTLKNWRDQIANYFNSRHSSGFVEGLNNKLKVIKRRCYGLLNPVRLFQRITLDLEGERLFA